MNQKFTLFQLNEQIRESLAETFPDSVWVIAEISEIKENRSGHCYLELIEKSGNEIIARSRATIWSYTYRILKPYFETTTSQPFTSGIKILVQVLVEYHPSFGLSLNIRDIDPVYTVGDLAVQRKEILARLEREGVLNMNKELELPVVPQRIAVISSKTAAGYEDFIKQLQQNDNGFVFYIRLFEAYMQGIDAIPSIIKALEKIFYHEELFDAVVIIRGGGGTADLSCFDNYELALNITQFPLPVITGIGHEKDDTITDMVAHTRMKTPTAVAEFLIKGAERFYHRILEAQNELIRLTNEIIESEKNNIFLYSRNFSELTTSYIREKNAGLLRIGNDLLQITNLFSFQKQYEMIHLKHKLESACSAVNLESKNKTRLLEKKLKYFSLELIKSETNALKQFNSKILNLSVRYLETETKRINTKENLIRVMNPENVLKRGFALVFKNGNLIKSVHELKPGEEILTQLKDGTITSKINNTDIDGKQKNDL